MARHRSDHPTNGELAILRALWAGGPGTVAQIRDRLEGSSEIGYTTVLKLLQIMTAKKFVRRNEKTRPHVYRAAVTEEATQGRILRDLIDRAFGGSSASLVLRALSAKPASAGELTEIRRLLDRGPEDPE